MTDKNETTIVNALNVAADQYDRDAAAIRQGIAIAGGEFPESTRLAEQFDSQAAEARRLASGIEAAGLDNVEYL